jgi:glycosyltransferase involved in cell wall biosynthesis
MRLLGDRREAETMGQRGLQRVRERFTVEKMVQSYENLYDDLLRAKGISTSGRGMPERGSHGMGS